MYAKQSKLAIKSQYVIFGLVFFAVEYLDILRRL